MQFAPISFETLDRVSSIGPLRTDHVNIFLTAFFKFETLRDLHIMANNPMADIIPSTTDDEEDAQDQLNEQLGDMAIGGGNEGAVPPGSTKRSAASKKYTAKKSTQSEFTMQLRKFTGDLKKAKEDGQDLRHALQMWLLQFEMWWNMKKIAMSKKGMVVGMHLEGRALDTFAAFKRSTLVSLPLMKLRFCWKLCVRGPIRPHMKLPLTY
jgi:hypothetical protein